MARDRIDELIDAWRAQLPGIDPAPMATIGRLARIAARITDGVAENLARDDLAIADVDVLFTLRRTGPPHEATPSSLASTLLVTSGGMTARLDRLERRGLIARHPDPGDRRSVRVALTDAGRDLVDRVLPGHVATEERLLSSLTKAERERLDALARKLLAGLEPDPG